MVLRSTHSRGAHHLAAEAPKALLMNVILGCFHKLITTYIYVARNGAMGPGGRRAAGADMDTTRVLCITPYPPVGFRGIYPGQMRPNFQP